MLVCCSGPSALCGCCHADFDLRVCLARGNRHRRPCGGSDQSPANIFNHFTRSWFQLHPAARSYSKKRFPSVHHKYNDRIKRRIKPYRFDVSMWGNSFFILVRYHVRYIGHRPHAPRRGPHVLKVRTIHHASHRRAATLRALSSHCRRYRAHRRPSPPSHRSS